MVRIVASNASRNPSQPRPPTPKARITVSRAATAAASVGVAMPA